MSLVTAIQSIASRWNSTDSFLNAPLRIVDRRSANLDKGGTPGTASFPRQPVAFLCHYVKRRPALHASAVASVLGAAAFACVAQFGLKLIVDAMAAGPQHIAKVWSALVIFAALLAAESALWRIGAWLGYRAILIDKAEAKLDLFNHLSGHCSRYFADRLGGALANRISATGDSVQQVFSLILFNLAPVCADFCAAMVMLTMVGWHLGAALAVFVLLAGCAEHRDTASMPTAPPKWAGNSSMFCPISGWSRRFLRAAASAGVSSGCSKSRGRHTVTA
jgi:hypothetical protein